MNPHVKSFGEATSGAAKGAGSPAGGITATALQENGSPESETHYRTLFDYVPDGIVIANAESYYLDANPSMCRMLGYTRDELIGMHARNIVIQTEIQHIGPALSSINARSDHRREWQFRRKDGSTFTAEVIATKMPDGNLLGLVRDVTQQKQNEREIARLSRLYAALSQVNQAIARAADRTELLRRVCQALVESGGFCMAWIGWHDPETRQLVPVADWGDQNGHLKSNKIYGDDRPEGRGPTGTAFRENRPCICNDMLTDPITMPWLREVELRGFNACAVFPIRMNNVVRATLSVYSSEPQFFQDQEISLLEAAAADISIALENLTRDEERREAENTALNEKLFSDTMIESMPGILYFYDSQGRFLRWSRNLETVSGYTSREIATMHPLDFFSAEDREMVQSRIAEVFEKDESQVEAPFVAKNGVSVPYFFTGRRVVFNGKECLVGVGIDVSERKRAELALKQSEQKLRAIFEQAPMGIAVIDSLTGKFQTLNSEYCRIAGYSENEMLGLTYQQITHPEDLQRDVDNMQGLLEGKQHTFRMEKRYRRKDGSVVWVSLTCVPLWEAPGSELHHLAMVEDITAQKLANDRLAENERKYRELVELANSIILRWNSEGRITFLNEFGQKFFGYSPEEILGRHVIGSIVPTTESSGRDLESLMERICEDPKAFEQNINENIRRNGDRVSIAWTNRIVHDAQGRVVEILSVGTDITERKRAEVALRELNETLELKVTQRTGELKSALVRAEAADQIKSAFLATMSHELRTPLNSIIGFTGILIQGLAGPLNPEQTKQLGMVRSSARHLLELINDVLDLSKIEAGQLEVRLEPFNLRDSIERVTTSVKPLAEKKGLLVNLVEPEKLGVIVGDRRRVEQILINLLNNAIKFTAQGGVTLTVEKLTDHQPAPAGAPGPALRFRVADTGIGIQAKDLPALFQPFRQIDSGLARQHEGTGLGLAICQRLARLMGGEISATSEWSKGSVFTVVIPLQDSPSA